MSAVPLIEIHTTRETPSTHVATLLAGRVAEALGARPDAAWIVWRRLDPAEVTIGPSGAGHSPADAVAIAHVYINRTPEQVEAVVELVEATLAQELDLDPARVIVTSHAFAI